MQGINRENVLNGVTSLFLLFNHRLTKNQEVAAQQKLKVARIVKPPADLNGVWRQIPPELSEIYGHLAPIREWLKSKASPGDYVLIQGDFGATYLMVTYAFESGFIPIYSTTYRKAIEEVKDDGSVEIKHNFDHRIFRRYGV